jgi:hypothetical protein
MVTEHTVRALELFNELEVKIRTERPISELLYFEDMRIFVTWVCEKLAKLEYEKARLEEL